MALGFGILLIVVGAVLAFAINGSIDSVDLTIIGYICMVAGALAIIISLVVNAQNRKTTHTEVIDQRSGNQANG